MESMEVDNLETSTSTTATVIEPIEGSSSISNDTHTVTSVTPQTTTVKSDLNTPWFVYVQTTIKRILFLFLS